MGLKLNEINRRRRFGLSIGLLLGVSSLASSPAFAQRQAGDDPEFGGTGTSISAPSGRGYSLTASLQTLYDTNILRGRFSNPTNDVHKSDFRFTPSVTAAYSLPVGRQQLFVGALVGRDIYAENSYLNRNRYTLAGGLNWRVGQACSGAVTAEYQRRQSLLSELSDLTNNVQETRVYNASADCLPPVGIGFGGGVRRSEVDNQRVQREAFNSRNTTFDAHANFGSATIGRFSAGGSYSKVNYPNREVLGTNGLENDGVDFMSGRVGYSRSLGPRLSLSLSGSYLKTKPQPRTILQPIFIFGFPVGTVPINRKGFSGGGYSFSLAYQPSPRLSIDINAGRDANASPNVGALFSITDNAGINVDYRVGPAITTGIGATYIRRGYRGSFASVEEPIARISDRNERVYAHIAYAPVKLYSVDFEVGHQRRNSNPSNYNFTSTTATLTLRVNFGRS